MPPRPDPDFPDLLQRTDPAHTTDEDLFDSPQEMLDLMHEFGLTEAEARTVRGLNFV